MATGLQQSLQRLRVRLIDPPVRSVTSFWNWWTAELLGALPASLREAISRVSKRVVVTPEDGELRFTEAGHSMQQAVAHMPLDAEHSPEALPEQISELVLALPADKALQCPMTLPLAAEENLREVLGFEMDRQTPFTLDRVYYDYRVRERQAANASITLDLIVSPKQVVDPYLDALARVGLVPVRVTTFDHNAELLPVNLLPRTMRQARRYSLPGINTVLAGTCVLLLIVALALPHFLNKREIARLEQEMVPAEAAAEGGLQLRREVERITRTSEFLTDKKRSSVLALEIIEEVSRVLPDNTWLTRLDINGPEIQLQGQSTAAAELIQLLESSPLFRNAQFRSPVVQVPRTSQERFHLSAQLETADST